MIPLILFVLHVTAPAPAPMTSPPVPVVAKTEPGVPVAPPRANAAVQPPQVAQPEPVVPSGGDSLGPSPTTTTTTTYAMSPTECVVVTSGPYPITFSPGPPDANGSCAAYVYPGATITVEPFGATYTP